MNPSYSYAYNYRGLAKSNSGDYLGAIEDFNKAVAIAPKYFDAINNRGWAYYNLKKTDKAISDYRLAISVYQSDVAYRNLAWAYYILNNFKGAIENYSITIKLSPSDSRAYFYRAMSYYKTDNLPEACKDWKKAKETGEGQAEGYLAKYCR